VTVTDVVKEGRHAMRLRTPSAGGGLRLWTLPVSQRL
jgi:hypothetical protein